MENHGTSWNIVGLMGYLLDPVDVAWGPALVSAEAKTPRWHPAKASRKPSRELRSPKTRPPPPSKGYERLRVQLLNPNTFK